MTSRFLFLFFTFFFAFSSLSARMPEITPSQATEKVEEILHSHASYKKISSDLLKRIFQNYLEQLDPNKTYFIKSDIQEFLEPSDAFLQKALEQYRKKDFSLYEGLHQRMLAAIARRHRLQSQIDIHNLPPKVKREEFKEIPWANTEAELLERLKRIRSLQIETAAKLNEEVREKSLQRLEKAQIKFEERFSKKPEEQQIRFVLSTFLKATASALDVHTSYFNPDEAEQFMIDVQHRLFGIGAQLRDDLNGFSVMKVIDGGPAAKGKELKVKDRIIAVNGEPVVGMDIIDAVELIRGRENTPVVLTVIREEGEGEIKKELKLDITVIRGEVVITEARYETSYQPFGEDTIGYVRLHSFYQDPEHSSAVDLAREIKSLKKEHRLKGLILDLRYNTGGMLSQAVAVTGLFIKKGIVVAVKDNTGAIQYLRNLEDKSVWDGPLMILTNRASASASEIVAQTLQDYGRALVVGDETTYGKGSFQTFTLNTTDGRSVDPQGEYKVTRGRYYTVSGKTPQLVGVKADIVLPGALSAMDLGERFAKYPLENDSIKENFNDDLSDIPESQRTRMQVLYRFGLQKKLDTYEPYLNALRKNAAYRIEKNKNYQAFLKELKKDEALEMEGEEQIGQNDLQLSEAYDLMKDLILMMQEKTMKDNKQ